LWLYLGCHNQLQARDGDDVISKNISYAVSLMDIVSKKLKGTVYVCKSTITIRKYDRDKIVAFSQEIGRLAHIDPADVSLSKYLAGNQDVISVPNSLIALSGTTWISDDDAITVGKGSNTILRFSVPFEVSKGIYICEVQVDRGPLSGHRDMYVFRVVNGEIEILGVLLVSVS